ncbi:MAG TPA: glycosyltransferase [Gemmataceae bacterium]|nr:glycosyltransferase [Gemmataceae bacterium]
MRKIMTASRRELEQHGHKYPDAALITFRDPFLAPAPAPQMPRLDLVMNDISDPSPGLTHPQRDHAARIYPWVAALPPDRPLIVQCEFGVGRSLACAAALNRAQGDEATAKRQLRHGTHNRRLYRLLCEEFGLTVEPEPLVAIACRVKYPVGRADAFLYSLNRQRYDTWKCVFVTDGINDAAWEEFSFETVGERKWEWIETPERRGLWGHPYRQLGIDRCLAIGAAYIGLNNDDNYLTPGYLEQMVNAAQDEGADLVMCQMLHSYSAWGVVGSVPVAGCADVGNWIASADLIRQVKFDEFDALADGRFVERLAAKAKKVASVERPLLIKN